MTAPQPSPLPAQMPAHLPSPTPQQQQIIDRIGLQRADLRQRRAAAQALRATRAQQVASGRINAQAALPQRLLEFARLHPLLVSVLAAASVVAGPKRVLRWVVVATPWATRLLRSRR